MGALGLENVSEPQLESSVSLSNLSDLTGFPVDYIKRELLLDDANEGDLSVEELRKKVLTYLDSNFK